jgi:addiction module RelE/StbE family toxin
MMVRWTNRSATELEAILFYIAKDNPIAGKQLVAQITENVDTNLAQNPKLGRLGQVAKTREYVVHKSYVVVYRVQKDEVEILSVRHTSRLWPESF